MKKRTARPEKLVIGWREWVSLPLLGVRSIKPKIDTGARSSALHAFDVQIVVRKGRHIARFKIHPHQRDSRTTVSAEAEVLEYRRVTSSGGHRTMRPVILTEIELCDQRWTIELTLANRDSMGFRMLLGREAVRGRFLVDPGRSFLAGKRQPIRKKKKAAKKRIARKETFSGFVKRRSTGHDHP